MVALKWTMKNHYGIDPGETFWAASDVGWVVGHSYICYAPLLHGCTSHPLRGQAGRHARRRRLLARHRRAQGGGDVHRADRLPRHQEGRPQGRAHQALRPARLPHAVPGRRARRPRDHQVGRDQPEGAGLRPLVADRDRLADLRQSGGPGRAAGEVRLADRADAGLRPAGAGRRRQAGQAGRDRHARRQAAAAAVLPADAVEQRRALPRQLPGRVSRATTPPRTPATSTPTATPS